MELAQEIEAVIGNGDTAYTQHGERRPSAATGEVLMGGLMVL